MTAGTTSGNGKVTSALLAQKLDYIAERLDTFCEKVEPKIRDLEITQAQHTEQISQLKSESRVWSVINSLGATVAAIIGFRQ